MCARSFTRCIVRSSVLCGMMAFAAFAGAEVLDKVIAVVNDEVVTQREFDRVYTPIKTAYEQNFQGEELQKRLEAARKGILDQLVDMKLAVSLAKKKAVKIDEEELKKRIATIKGYYASDDEFNKALSDKGTNLTEFEKDIREQMLAQELVNQEVASKISITPAEVEELYTKNRDKLVSPLKMKLQSILIRKGDGVDPAVAKKKADDLLAEIKGGADFTKVATEKSEGPYAAQGGEMGFVSPGQMVKEIDDVVFVMKPGDMSGVIETEMGYHIFKVEERQEARPLELAEVEEFLRAQLYRKKFEENLVKWIEEKKKNAFISFK